MSRTRRLVAVLALNLSLVAGLVAAGTGAHSLGVLAEGGDYFLDAAGAGLALWAFRVRARQASRSARWTRLKATGLAALINSGWLMVLELLVAAAAVDRLATRTPEVDGLAVLVASGIAALVMTVAAFVLRRDGDRERDVSVTAVMLGTVADAAAAAGVAVAGAIILVVGGWYWLDPAVALAIAVVVAYHAARLVREVLHRTGPRGQPGAPRAGR